MSLSTYYLEYGHHVGQLRRRRRRRRRAYAPTSNTASHENHEKILSWVSFAFLYEYGAPLGGPKGRRSSANITKTCITFYVFCREKWTYHSTVLLKLSFLPLNVLYYKTLSELMHDVSTASAPINISNLFAKTSSVHSYDARSSTSDNFYIKPSKLEIQKNASSRIGAKLWNKIPSSLKELPKKSFKLRIKKQTTKCFSKTKISSLRFTRPFPN